MENRKQMPPVVRYIARAVTETWRDAVIDGRVFASSMIAGNVADHRERVEHRTYVVTRLTIEESHV